MGVPGPNAYTIDNSDGMVRKFSPRPVFGSSGRNSAVRGSRNEPGPGSYSLRNMGVEGRPVSFSGRREALKNNGIPGPGQYVYRIIDKKTQPSFSFTKGSKLYINTGTAR